MGDKLLSKISKGALEVHYPDAQVRRYGDDSSEPVVLHLHSSNFFKRIALYGDVGFGESYMDGEFETNDLSKLITLALINSHALGVKSEDDSFYSFSNVLPHINRFKHLMRSNSKEQSQKNIAQHYDLSNDFFKLMLDETMMYSCAYFNDKQTPLYEAQREKIERLAQKLGVKKGDHVLEIGSGWGAVALYLAKELECNVTTVTLSREQKALCEERFLQEGVADKITVLLQDYRDLEGRFDAIISVEMFEAVGEAYFGTFFKQCAYLLKPHGRLVMQVITIPDQRYKAYSKSTDFIQKYIFPGGHLPSIERILHVTKKHTRFNLFNMEELGEHYAKTLKIWDENFSQNIEKVRELGFDEYFLRMWKMYLNYCESAFITRNIGLAQLVFSNDQNMELNEGLL